MMKSKCIYCGKKIRKVNIRCPQCDSVWRDGYKSGEYAIKVRLRIGEKMKVKEKKILKSINRRNKMKVLKIKEQKDGSAIMTYEINGDDMKLFKKETGKEKPTVKDINKIVLQAIRAGIKQEEIV